MSAGTTRKAETSRWRTSFLRALLHTPMAQHVAGRFTALITFIGPETGKMTTRAVAYACRDNKVIIAADVSDIWWRDLWDHPIVQLRLAGSTFAGRALILHGSEALADLTAFFEGRPYLARRRGLSTGAYERIDATQVEALLDDTVAIVVYLSTDGSARATTPIGRIIGVPRARAMACPSGSASVELS